MMYVDFTAGGKDYKLRLNTRNIVELEKRIGLNPALLFGMDKQNMRIPTITEMIAVLGCSLSQLNHGVKFDDAYDIFDAYIEDGHETSEFMGVVTEIFKVSGIFTNKKKTEEEGSEKNA